MLQPDKESKDGSEEVDLSRGSLWGEVGESHFASCFKLIETGGVGGEVHEERSCFTGAVEPKGSSISGH